MATDAVRVSGIREATASDDHIIAIAEPSNMRMEALASGIVERGPGGCMVLIWSGESMLILFPHGTRLEAGDVVLPNGSRVQAGEEKAMGGGLHYLPGPEVKELAAVPAGCITEHVWVASDEHSDGIAR